MESPGCFVFILEIMTYFVLGRNLTFFKGLVLRPLHNTPFCPITASGSNFNPRNTQCIPVVEIIAFLVLGQNWTFFKGIGVIRVVTVNYQKDSWLQ